MNILLANMPIAFNKRENLEPPLGVCYIAAMLRKIDGVNVYLKDYEITSFSPESLERDLKKMRIDVLGVSFRTASYRSAKEFIKTAKEINKNIFVVAGGHHATAFPKETMVDIGCDAVIMGEGEYAFKELVERLNDNVSLEGLRGVVYRNNNSDIIMNEERPPIENIDELPWPARDLLEMDEYNVITILTSRGCPFNCIYCDKAISTRKVKFRAPDDIFNEMKNIVDKFHKHRLYVVDDHFFLKRNRLEPVLDRVISEKLPIKWTCQARVDGIVKEVLEKAKAAGCEQIMYGIETGDENELQYIRKASTLKDAEEAVRLTKDAGITARANFMLGFPISTKGSMRNTINFAGKIKPDIVRFFAVSPLPNTDLWDYIYGKGYIPENIKWEDIDFFKPSFDLKNITRGEVSLYVTAGYWHVLKKEFLKEVTIGLIPNMLKLFYLIARTRKIRGNISQCFPRMVNLVVDNMHQVQGKSLKEIVTFIKDVRRIEKTLK